MLLAEPVRLSGVTGPDSPSTGVTAVRYSCGMAGDVDYSMVAGHLDECRRRNLAVGTVYRRRQCGERLADWMHPRPLTDTRTVDVDVFLDARARGPRPIGARSRYHWISHLHAMFDWALRHQLIDADPTATIIRPKIDRLLPRPIADHDLADALRQAAPMMRAWLLAGSLAGLRCAEIAGLGRADVLEADMLLRVIGKGRRERLVPLHPDLLDALRRHGLPRTGHLFVRPRGQPYTPSMVSREINLYLHSIGVDATAHQLRHWFGTHAYRQCRDLRTVQELLGHASPTTTAIYTAASPLDARTAVAGLGVPG